MSLIRSDLFGKTTASRTSDRVFYAGMAFFAAGFVLLGFGPTFYLNHYYAHRVLTPLAVTHGIAFTMWMALLITQTLLVTGGRTDIHRRLGIVGDFLAVLMVMLGLTTTIMLAKRSLRTSREMRELAFPTLVICAFYFRQRPEIHKRLMLVATFILIEAAVARIHLAVRFHYREPAFFALTDLLLLFCIAYGLASRRRVHPAYLWAGLEMVGGQALRLHIGSTAALLSIAHWIVTSVSLRRGQIGRGSRMTLSFAVVPRLGQRRPLCSAW